MPSVSGRAPPSAEKYASWNDLACLPRDENDGVTNADVDWEMGLPVAGCGMM